jgi:hypothetical protein
MVKRTPLVVVILGVVLPGVGSGSLAALPRLDGTFKTHFVVLAAQHVQPGRGTTGTRTWIFEHQDAAVVALVGLANGRYERVRLHRSGTQYVGSSRVSAACVGDPSSKGESNDRYSVRVTRSVLRSGRLTATAIRAYLHATYSGCGTAGAFEVRRYVGHRVG